MAVSTPMARCNQTSSSSDRDVCNINKADLEYIRYIGNGTFANVYLAKWRGESVAVKEYTRAEHMPYFEAETRQLARASHPNIIALFAKSIPQRLLVMEFSEMGALDEVIDKAKYKYNAGHAVSWARQAADGIAHLHKANVLHRDLKPANMLLFNGGIDLKLTDFGTSCLQRTYLTSDRGSPAWMAPEVWHTNDYNEKCDIYSWAVVFWQIISRRQPFQGLNMYQVMWKVVNGDRLPTLKKCPSVIQRLITDCWDGDKSKRPSMVEVCQRMAILQKLFPGGDRPVEVLQVLPESDDSSTCSSAFNTMSRIDTISGIYVDLPDGEKRDSDNYQLHDDLGSLAVTDDNNHNHLNLDMMSTLTPISGSSQSSSLSVAAPGQYNGNLVLDMQSAAPRFELKIPPERRISADRANPATPPLVIAAATSSPSPVPEANNPVVALSDAERMLMVPRPVDPNAPLSSIIREHHVSLQKAFVSACAKIDDLKHVKNDLVQDLENARSEERAAHERVRQYQQISAENEDLIANILPFVGNNQQ